MTRRYVWLIAAAASEPRLRLCTAVAATASPYPGITQEVAPNESQRGPNAAASEALIYKTLFVALGCALDLESFTSSPRNHRRTRVSGEAAVSPPRGSTSRLELEIASESPTTSPKAA